jgi:hypothetical protein
MIRNTLVTAAGFAVVGLAQQAGAVITLTSNNSGSPATYSSTLAATTTNANIGDATMSGDTPGTDQLFDNAWFWRLANDTREFQFSQTGVVENALGNTGSRTWANPALGGQFSAVLNLTLTDGVIANQAILQQSMVITNTSGTVLNMSVFNFLDADVAGSIGGDTAAFAGPNNMQVTDSLGQFIQFEGVGANAFQAAAFPALGNLLVDAAVTNLNNSGIPFGPGDWTGAYQWNIQLGTGQSITIVENISINMQIPGPGALALLGVAGMLGRNRRRR